MNKKGQLDLIKIMAAIVLFLLIAIPFLNVLNNPEKLLELLPGLFTLVIFFEFIRRILRL